MLLQVEYISCNYSVTLFCTMVVYATPCVSVEYRKVEKVLLINWETKPDTITLRETYSRVLQLATAEEYATNIFCTNMSLCGAFTVEQENWLSQEYYPQVYSGIRDNVYAAVVFTEEHFKAIITNYKDVKTDTFHSFMHLNYFTNTAEAFSWLKSIKKGQDAALLPNSVA